jgi:hypothetical protein
VAGFAFIRANTSLVPKERPSGAPPPALAQQSRWGPLARADKDINQFWDDVVEAFGHGLNALRAAGSDQEEMEDLSSRCLRTQ